MKKYKGIIIALIIIILIVVVCIAYKKHTAKPGDNSYTKYNDKNFPGLVKYAEAPRETGNPIADIQLERMYEANPGLQIES